MNNITEYVGYIDVIERDKEKCPIKVKIIADVHNNITPLVFPADKFTFPISEEMEIILIVDGKDVKFRRPEKLELSDEQFDRLKKIVNAFK